MKVLILSLLSLLFVMNIDGVNYTDCVTTGTGNAQVSLDKATLDEINSNNQLVRFAWETDGDVCLRTRDSITQQYGPRWCVSYEGAAKTGTRFVIDWNGDLTYYQGVNVLWSSGTQTATDVSPLQFCVNDCGKATFRRVDNSEELWNTTYYNKQPTVFPTCPAPSSAPTMSPTNPPTTPEPTTGITYLNLYLY